MNQSDQAFVNSYHQNRGLPQVKGVLTLSQQGRAFGFPVVSTLGHECETLQSRRAALLLLAVAGVETDNVPESWSPHPGTDLYEDAQQLLTNSSALQSQHGDPARVVTVTADTKDVVGISDETAQAILANSSMRLELIEPLVPVRAGSELSAHKVESLPEIAEWANRQMQWCAEQLNGEITACVWPYRMGGGQYLAVDLNGVTGSAMFTFTTGVSNDFAHGDNVRAPDMVEALHMVGALFSRLKIHAISVGLPDSAPR